LAAIFGKERKGAGLVFPLFEDFDRFTPRQLLRRIDLAQIQDVALHDSPVSQTFVFDDTEVAVLFAVFLAGCRAQKHLRLLCRLHEV